MDRYRREAEARMKTFQQAIEAREAGRVVPVDQLVELETIPPPPPPPVELVLDPSLRNLPPKGDPTPRSLAVSGRLLRDPARIRLALDFARISGDIPSKVFYDSLRSLERDLASIRRRARSTDRGRSRERRRSRERQRSDDHRRSTASRDRGRQTFSRSDHSSRRSGEHVSRKSRNDSPPPSRRRSQEPSGALRNELQQERDRFNRSDEERRQLAADVMRIRGEREQLRVEVQALRDFIIHRGLTPPKVPLPPASVFQSGVWKSRALEPLGGRMSWYRSIAAPGLGGGAVGCG